MIYGDVYDLFSQHIIQVVHNRGLGFLKRFNPAGVPKCNHTRSINPMAQRLKVSQHYLPLHYYIC